MVELKHQLVLDLNYQKFEKQRYPISEILNKNNYFFQVYELKQKFGYITINSSHKNEVVRKFSSCLIQKINGFFIVRIENKGEIRKTFLPIDIIYKLVKTTKKIDCNFSDQTNLAFPSTFSEGEEGGIRHVSAWKCYCCSNYYGKKDKFDRHFQICSGQPGIDYNFNTQSSVSFEDNITYKNDIPLTAYVDFEFTAPTNSSLDPEDRKMFTVS